MSRDKTIDRLRGFAMLWVIVVHVLYWGSFFDNETINRFKSFCLFEMPLFFFVTGASNSFSKTNGYVNFVYRRYKRVLIPYWVFAIICAGLSIVKYSFSGNMDISNGIKIVLSWLIPIDKQMTSIPYLTWALWFIPVYMCVILVIPMFKRMKQSQERVRFLFLLLIVFVCTCLCKMGWIQNVTFYSLWTYIGLFYPELKTGIENKKRRTLFLAITVIGSASLVVIYFSGATINMQSNKFPPNITFLIFSMVMMSLLILIMPLLDRTIENCEKCRFLGKIIVLFSTRSMTIFLYQVFAFNISIRVVDLLFSGASIVLSIFQALLCFVLTLPLCSGLALIFGEIENWGSSRKGPSVLSDKCAGR